MLSNNIKIIIISTILLNENKRSTTTSRGPKDVAEGRRRRAFLRFPSIPKRSTSNVTRSHNPTSSCSIYSISVASPSYASDKVVLIFCRYRKSPWTRNRVDDRIRSTILILMNIIMMPDTTSELHAHFLRSTKFEICKLQYCKQRSERIIYIGGRINEEERPIVVLKRLDFWRPPKAIIGLFGFRIRTDQVS